MSNLYIRVMTGFYTHRKTARLRSLIGDDAFWIPPRLWAYCAENQPDGNLSSYSSDEIAMLVGCVKHSSSILEALKTSGFIDPDGVVHDWDAYNGYHKRYSERAKAAADARWSKKKEAKKKDIGHRTVDSGDKHCLEHACSIYQAYPKKVGKKKAIESILKALKTNTPEFLLEKVNLYAAARKGQDQQYTLHPTTFFNGEHYHDDPAAWKPSNGIFGKPSTDRNAGTANEGKSSQYAGVGKVVQVQPGLGFTSNPPTALPNGH